MFISFCFDEHLDPDAHLYIFNIDAMITLANLEALLSRVGLFWGRFYMCIIQEGWENPANGGTDPSINTK